MPTQNEKPITKNTHTHTSIKSLPPSHRNSIIETTTTTNQKQFSHSVEFNRMSKNSSKSHGKVPFCCKEKEKESMLMGHKNWFSGFLM